MQERRDWLAHLENCLNKGGGNEAATDKHRFFGGVTYIARKKLLGIGCCVRAS